MRRLGFAFLLLSSISGGVARAHPELASRAKLTLKTSRTPFIEVRVNGLDLRATDRRPQAIQLDPARLDRVFVKVAVDRGVKYEYWARFRAGGQYVMADNPCTLLAVWPKRENRRVTRVLRMTYRFTNKSERAVWFGAPNHCEQIGPGSSTYDVYNFEGEMCLWSPADFNVYSVKLTGKTNNGCSGTPLASAAFAFLHEERISIRYLGTTQLDVSLDNKTDPKGK